MHSQSPASWIRSLSPIQCLRHKLPPAGPSLRSEYRRSVVVLCASIRPRLQGMERPMPPTKGIATSRPRNYPVRFSLGVWTICVLVQTLCRNLLDAHLPSTVKRHRRYHAWMTVGIAVLGPEYAPVDTNQDGRIPHAAMIQSEVRSPNTSCRLAFPLLWWTVASLIVACLNPFVGIGAPLVLI
jgi:hypothetical protein